jgi:hypothetical protein
MGVEREGMWLSTGEIEDGRKRIYENMVHRVGDMSHREFRNRLLSKVWEEIREQTEQTWISNGTGLTMDNTEGSGTVYTVT